MIHMQVCGVQNIHSLVSTVLDLSVFFAPVRYRVIKIIGSYFEVVLRTTKYTMVYPGSCPSLKVIVLHPAV
jgi:hypothetical protein